MNFLENVKQYQERALKDLQKILKINSVYDEKTITKEMPFGKGINDALTSFLDMAKQDGFQTFNDEGYAGVIEYGEGPETIGVICHLDVVPAGNNWECDPFEAVVKNGKLIARGAMDDKGPTMAAYYALKIIKDMQLPLSKKIQIILGTDEETAWRGINHYRQKYQLPDTGFAPDADFPLIYGEKGILHTILRNNEIDEEVLYVKGGERFNVVIDYAEALTKHNHQELFQAYLQNNQLKGEMNQKDEGYQYIIKGVSAHAMEPFKGVNAGTHLLNFLSNVSNHPYIKLGSLLHEDYGLKKLGLYYEHPEMGKLTCNIGIIEFGNGQNKLTLDMRCPTGFSNEKFFQVLENLKAEYHLETEIVENKDPHYVDPHDPLVDTLYQAYVKYTNDTTNKPCTIGGGTYARTLKHAVAFGMEMPGNPSVAHQPNEFISIDEFYKGIAIYAEAIYQLGK